MFANCLRSRPLVFIESVMIANGVTIPSKTGNRVLGIQPQFAIVVPNHVMVVMGIGPAGCPEKVRRIKPAAREFATTFGVEVPADEQSQQYKHQRGGKPHLAGILAPSAGKAERKECNIGRFGLLKWAVRLRHAKEGARRWVRQ